MFILAISDLVVGVANDAVNFTNSAIGSKVSSRAVILIIACLGILLGSLSSTGMMEVARKGIFKPELFSLENLLFIFLSVMITDILLLDFYNTFGLPTSTTVSLVFELFGASLMMAYLNKPVGVDAFDYINSQSAIKIISGIFLSILIAFIAGVITQGISRIIFTFNLRESMKYFGGFFASLSTTIVLFFILISALKDSTFAEVDAAIYIQSNLSFIFIITTALLWVVFQTAILLGYDIFKFIILFGTFALAMAFAGNDLVNFVGVPIAGFNTIQLILETGNPQSLGIGLTGKVQIPTIFLFVAAIVMILTLLLSKKAHTVTKTEISLASEKNEYEAFASNEIGRRLVGIFLDFWSFLKEILPESFKNSVKTRYKRTPNSTTEDRAFDSLRASVNITTASLIIMTGSLWKLPLSTTFVTFMVAMGSSLADRAWSRQSSVSRVSGVLTVIAGWLLTAMITSMISAVVVSSFYFLSFYALLILLPTILFFIYTFSKIHHSREREAKETLEKIELIRTNPDSSIRNMLTTMSESLLEAGKSLDRILDAHTSGKRKHLKGTKKVLNKLSIQYSKYMSRIAEIDESELTEKAWMSAFSLESCLHSFRRIINNIITIRNSVAFKLENYFSALTNEEEEDLVELKKSIFELFSELEKLSVKKKSKITSTKLYQKRLANLKYNIHKNQIRRVKKGKSHLNTLVPYLTIAEEMMDLNNNLIDLHENLEKTLSIGTVRNKKLKG